MKDGKLALALQWWAESRKGPIPREHFDALNGVNMLRFTDIDQWYELDAQGYEAMKAAGLKPLAAGFWRVGAPSRGVDQL